MGSFFATESPHLSQCSPAWKTGTMLTSAGAWCQKKSSQCSPAWKTGTIDLVEDAAHLAHVVSM